MNGKAGDDADWPKKRATFARTRPPVRRAMSDHGGRLDRPLSRPVLAHTTPLLLHVSLLYSHGMHLGTSAIIPVRNGANFIREAISSVLAQLDRGDN